MPATVLVPSEALHRQVGRLGRDVSVAYPQGVVLIALLKGSVVFLADLVRAMSTDVVVDFLALSPYAEGGGRARLLKDLDVDVAGQPVVLVQDVVDTGLTLAWTLAELARRGPRSVDVCALVDRRARRLVPVTLRWVGFDVGERFVVGYGLDYRGRYRNLDLLAAGDPGALRADPDAHLAELYGAR
ncbi:MAG: hypoxanthine phosphoribosyltransferase [Actinomycetota bacterium]|nr:hypoxanthine phosphoribosyltransferase [Actinomycetota bacterium]